jgi:hypothetical protein
VRADLRRLGIAIFFAIIIVGFSANDIVGIWPVEISHTVASPIHITEHILVFDIAVKKRSLYLLHHR